MDIPPLTARLFLKDLQRFDMPQIGSEKNPIRMSPTKKIKISGQYLKNEDRKKYEDNYDRIFGKKEKAV
mgnify:CR=1 FL=1